MNDSASGYSKRQIKIDFYLSEIEGHLGALDTVQKAEALIDFKNQIEKKVNENPGESTDSILASFGSAQKLARDYLLSRGLTYQPPKKRSSVLGRLFIAGLVFVVSIVVIISLSAWYFSPIMDFDESSNQWQFFGGNLNFEDITSQMTQNMNFKSTQIVDGVLKETVSGKKQISDDIEFLNISAATITLQLNPSADRSFSWKCELDAVADDPTSLPIGHQVYSVQDGLASIDLKSYDNSRCILAIPEMIPTFVEAYNAQVKLSEIHYPLHLDLENGRVVVEEDLNREYSYKQTVTNGEISDQLKESVDSNAIPIKIEIENGSVEVN